MPDAEPVPAYVAASAWRTGDGTRMACLERLIEESPVALVYNGISHAVMLASPSDLEDFAVGFSLCEGIITSPGEIYGIEVAHGALGIETRIELAAERFMSMKARRRSLAGRTGCGLCGVDSLAAALRPVAPVQDVLEVGPAAVLRAIRDLPGHQTLHRLTGAGHAAAWADRDGRILMLREDVGRHNALDKLIGGLLREGIAPASGFAVVTSRASYEMVQKLGAFGGGLLAAVSAPTAAAVRVAQESNITLVGFVREDRFTTYTTRSL
ncbi:Sulfur carrier protein [Aromatoleum petrolei]|nr:Sulfur carrier protein [Aromatoleum petrolei]